MFHLFCRCSVPPGDSPLPTCHEVHQGGLSRPVGAHNGDAGTHVDAHIKVPHAEILATRVFEALKRESEVVRGLNLAEIEVWHLHIPLNKSKPA